MKNFKLLHLGLIIPFIFWCTLLVCGLMTENYNHLTNMVSELGAIGTKTQYIFNVSLMICAVLSIIFMFSLLKIAKKTNLNRVPIYLILVFAFSLFGSALFPLPLKLHGILGSPVLIFPLSPLLTLIFWKESIIKNIKIYSLLIFISISLGFLTLFPNFLDQYFGLQQRFFHIGWSLWFIYLSLSFIQLEKRLS